MVVAILCYGTVSIHKVPESLRGVNATKCSKILEKKKLRLNWDLREDLFTSKTLTPNLKPNLQKYHLKRTVLMSWCGAESRPQSYWEFVAECENSCSLSIPNATWQSLNSLAKKNGENWLVHMSKLIETYKLLQNRL